MALGCSYAVEHLFRMYEALNSSTCPRTKKKEKWKDVVDKTGNIQAFLQDHITSAMNRRRSCSVNVKKTEHNPEKTCKAFQDISKYFSKEEWAKMSYSEKITYVYMKRNYTTMTKLGLRTHLPDFMESKEKATKSVLNDSDESCGQESQERNESKLSIWSHRLRERKKPVIYEEISDPEEEDEDEEEKGWTYRRNKPVI